MQSGLPAHASDDTPTKSASNWHGELGTGWPSPAGDSTPSLARGDEQSPPRLTYLLLLAAFTLASLIDIVWFIDGIFFAGQLFALALSVLLLVDAFRGQHARALGFAYLGVLVTGTAVNLATPEFPSSGPWWFLASYALSTMVLVLSALIVDRRGFIWRYGAIGCLVLVPAGILMAEYVVDLDNVAIHWWGDFRVWVTLPMSIAMMIAVWTQWRQGRKADADKPLARVGR